MDAMRRRSASLADDAKREPAALRRRVTMSASVDSTATTGGQDINSPREPRRFPLVPSTNRESTTITQEKVQDDHEDNDAAPVWRPCRA